MLARRRPRGVWALGPLNEVQNNLERFFEDVWPGESDHLMSYDLDVHEDAEHVYVEAELPGLTKDDIEMTLEDNVLTIRGEKKLQRDQKEGNFHLSERRYGRFSRSLRLPTVVDENKVQASLKEGVLKVTLDKREEVKPRKIEVKVD
jgi:HSP20 family protein